LFAAFNLNAIFCLLPSLAASDDLQHIAKEAQINALVVEPRHVGQDEELYVSLDPDIQFCSLGGPKGLERRNYCT